MGITELTTVAGMCGGIIVLALAVLGLVLVIAGARARNRSDGSAAGLIVGVVCLLFSGCVGCSLLAVLLGLISAPMQ